MILAQEIVVDHADYPTAKIAWNSHLYRPLGLGYANLGALLMARGVAVRQRRGSQRGRGDHRADVRRGVSDQRRDRRGDGPVLALREEPRRLPRSDRHAQGGGRRDRRDGRAGGSARGGARELGARARARPQARLQERAGHGARADRHDRVHDGLRHHGRGAGHRAGQVQEAGRRRPAQDRQPDRADGAAPARLLGGRRSRRSSRWIDEQRDDRGRARPARGAPRRCSTARSARPRASARSTGWATSA